MAHLPIPSRPSRASDTKGTALQRLLKAQLLLECGGGQEQPKDVGEEVKGAYRLPLLLLKNPEMLDEALIQRRNFQRLCAGLLRCWTYCRCTSPSCATAAQTRAAASTAQRSAAARRGPPSAAGAPSPTSSCAACAYLTRSPQLWMNPTKHR